MARKSRRSSTAATLDEFETLGERATEWISSHPVPILAAVAVCVVGAVIFGVHSSLRDRRENAASDALDQVQTAYLRAMGAPPGALEPPQLANPEAAHAIQKDYVAKFRAVAEAHPDTVAGALAGLQEGDLERDLGDPDAAIAAWTAAADALRGNDRLRGLALERIAYLHEDAGRWLEAAQAYRRAGDLEDYPLRHWAMLDAARCYAEAGDGPEAVALFDRVRREAPDLVVPPHLRNQLRELRSTVPGSAAAPPPAPPSPPSNVR